MSTETDKPVAKPDETVKPENEFPGDIKKLHEENARARIKNKELAEKLTVAESKAAEFDALKAAQMAEQGKYKELLEEANKKLSRLPELETRLTEIDARLQVELDSVKKGLTVDEINIVDDTTMTIEKRLSLARLLAGKKTSLPDEARGGIGNGTSVEVYVKEYRDEKTPLSRKMELLYELEKLNPSVYKELTKS